VRLPHLQAITVHPLDDFRGLLDPFTSVYVNCVEAIETTLASSSRGPLSPTHSGRICCCRGRFRGMDWIT